MMLKRILFTLLVPVFVLTAFSCSSNPNDNSTESTAISQGGVSVEYSEDSSIAEESSTETESAEDGQSSLYDESEEISFEPGTADSSESSEDSELSEVSSLQSDSEETSEIISSSDEISEEEIDPALADTFVIYGPEISYDLTWESDGLELYNTEFRMSEELVNKFKRQIGAFANAQSIMLIELDTNMTFAYSKDTKIATASSIKGPVGLYVNKCIDAGIISWDTYKTYQPRHFQANSTGNIKFSPYGTSFNVKTLMDYMIRISDNQAYLMLKELVGASNFNYMMKTLGCSEIIAPGSNWGYITAKEMAAAWREIYYYSLESESGAGLFDRYMHAQYNYIWRAIPQYEAAHKSGWSGKAFNDAGVVFADGHEYVLVVLCGRSGVEDPRSQYQFTQVTRLLAELMVEFNAYKEENGL